MVGVLSALIFLVNYTYEVLVIHQLYAAQHFLIALLLWVLSAWALAEALWVSKKNAIPLLGLTAALCVQATVGLLRHVPHFPHPDTVADGSALAGRLDIGIAAVYGPIYMLQFMVICKLLIDAFSHAERVRANQLEEQININQRAEAALLQANDGLAAANADLDRHRQQLETIVLERTRNLAAAVDTAERASRAKSVLLTNMSHELRTPLNHILGFTYLMAKDSLSEMGQERMAKIRLSASSLLRLIENLLDTARVESNQLHIEGMNFEFGSIIDRVKSSIRADLEAKAIELQCVVAGDANQMLHGDRNRIAQVITELLGNALKFSEVGPVILRATLAETQSSYSNLHVEVEDHGIGIPLETQASMFQLFIQADGSSSRKYGGTGLGLALCQRLVNLMAGDIGFESTPGQGTRFWIDIPVSKASARLNGESLPHREPPLEVNHLLNLLKSGNSDARTYWVDVAPQLTHLIADIQFVFEDALESGEYDRAAILLERCLGNNT